ncbi:MAG: hypothetical protein ACLTT1_16170 [[Clostridium] scindens]
MDVKVAVASGLGNARTLLNKVKSGEVQTTTSSRSWDARAAASTAADSRRYPAM